MNSLGISRNLTPHVKIWKRVSSVPLLAWNVTLAKLVSDFADQFISPLTKETVRESC